MRFLVQELTRSKVTVSVARSLCDSGASWTTDCGNVHKYIY